MLAGLGLALLVRSAGAQPADPERPAPAATAPSGPSPAATLLRSIAFPGWGQLENDRPFKAALVFTVEAGLLAGGAVEYRRALRSRDDELAAALRGDTAEAAEQFQRYLDRRGRAVNRFWWSAFTLMMSMIDAYTDAHLRDFVPAPEPALQPELESALDPAVHRLGFAVRF